MKIGNLLKGIIQFNQVQYSFADQLYQLKKIAYKLELFKAYDYINKLIEAIPCGKLNDDLFVDLIINSWEDIEKEEIHESSAYKQLLALTGFAVKFGLYDVDDFIRKELL